MSDVTTLLEDLGQPFTKSIYARNVWDMQNFNNKIYLGHGNSSNYSPSPNAGKIPIVCFDINQNKFITEFTVDEEQIDKFKIIDNTLCIPGHDSKEDWIYGNFYRYDNNIWVKYRTIPKAVHVYDMVMYNGKLFAAITTESSGAKVLSSPDMGKTWTEMTVVSSTFKFARLYDLFILRDSLYGCQTIYLNTCSTSNILKITNGNSISKIDTTIITANKMFPNTPQEKTPIDIVKMTRCTNFNNGLLYIGARPNNDHQSLPLALYFAVDINICKRISLPDSNVIPMDIIVRGNTVYVMAYIKNTSNYTNVVYKSSDLSTWTEVLSFTKDTFARSFEESDGDFYFGLGCNTDVLPESTGRILRVKSGNY